MTIITYQFVEPRRVNADAVISTWVEAIEQKDMDYYAYLCRHGRDSSWGQREEAEHLKRALNQGSFTVLFAQYKAESEKEREIAGLLIARHLSSDAQKISRLCSKKKMHTGEDITNEKVGTGLFGTFTQNLSPEVNKLTTEAHASGEGFWTKLGFVRNGEAYSAYGTRLVDMTMDEDVLIHWREHGHAPV